MVESGIILLKYWLEVSAEEQTRRLEARIDDGRKIWKLSPMDLKSYSRWYDYSRARDDMFKATDTGFAPWYVATSDDKRRARLNIISHLLDKVPYKKPPRDKVKLPERQKPKRLSRAGLPLQVRRGEVLRQEEKQRMLRPIWLVAGCIGLVAASSYLNAEEQRSSLTRQTGFGPVVGVDNSGTSGTYAWKGVPFAKPPVGELRWKAPVDPDSWREAKLTQKFGNACAQYGRIYGPGANNRYDATIATTLNQAVGTRGLPVPEHLAPGHARRRAAGHRLRPRRQQHLGLHRRPGVRRRGAREDRQCGRRHGQLPPRHLRLPQRAAAEDRQRRGQTTPATSRCSTSSRRCSSSSATSPTSAAIRPTSR